MAVRVGWMQRGKIGASRMAAERGRMATERGRMAAKRGRMAAERGRMAAGSVCGNSFEFLERNHGRNPIRIIQ